MVVFFLSNHCSCTAQRHLRVVAQPGDGIYPLLRKYQLLDYPCNLNEFYRLNKLKNNAALRVGETYEMPILTVAYNGKSIRSSTDNSDYVRALAIQHYNEELLEADVRATDFRKDKILYVPHHVDHCFDQKRGPAAGKELTDIGEANPAGKPSASSTPPGGAPKQTTSSAYRTFDIFGEKYAYVEKKSNRLAGRVFYIVSGHGGPDPGALGRRGNRAIPEDEYAYDVALRLTRNILAHGGTPYMIVRDTDGIRDKKYLKIDKDETVWGGGRIPLNQKARLQQRTNIINQLYDENLARGVTRQMMISIHVDSRHKDKRVDMYFYHYENDLRGAKQAEKMRAAVHAAYGRIRKGRGYTGTIGMRDLFVLRETKPPGVFIELANMANPADQVRIIEPRNRQLMADWLLEGLF